MGNDIVPVDRERRREVALQVADLRDEIHTLKKRMHGTVGAGVAVTVVISACALFVGLDGLVDSYVVTWCLLNLWFVFVHRAAGQKLRTKEAEIEGLERTQAVVTAEGEQSM
jgi:hypothetical protein